MTTIEAARLLIKIVVAKHLHNLAPITHVLNNVKLPMPKAFGGGCFCWAILGTSLSVLDNGRHGLTTEDGRSRKAAVFNS